MNIDQLSNLKTEVEKDLRKTVVSALNKVRKGTDNKGYISSITVEIDTLTAGFPYRVVDQLVQDTRVKITYVTVAGNEVSTDD